MDILFETMIATPLTFSLLIAGISMAIVGLFIGAVEATDAKGVVKLEEDSHG